MSRRLPVYLLIDNSGSMRTDEKIEAVNEGLQMFVDSLAMDPHLLQTAYVSVISFNTEARQEIPLTDVYDFATPELRAGGKTALGGALRLVKECAEREVRKGTPDQKGDWRPIVFLMTDGAPTDDFEAGLAEFKQYKWGKVIACAVGSDADPRVLTKITPTVVQLAFADSSTLHSFFSWASSSLGPMSDTLSSGGDLDTYDLEDDVPPPPGLDFFYR
ncbi:MAG: VWA domain-containing protein [Thermoguttaceae bacterium]|nr:VWA domain-containing protein [Thermoguttaceae bacterium]MBQ9799994.1 VWA domain-containing protein [Thermoguttaceae bacterium]